MYIIIAMAKIWKEVLCRCKLLRAVFLIVDYAKFVVHLKNKTLLIHVQIIFIKNNKVKKYTKISVTTNIEFDFPKYLCQYLSQNLTRVFKIETLILGKANSSLLPKIRKKNIKMTS